MDEDLPDFTMCLPFPTLAEELSDDLPSRLQAAIAALHEQLREQGEVIPSS